LFDFSIDEKLKGSFFERLEEIYGEMKVRYEIVASSLGFTCENCSENCCYTHFRHHTLIEYLYMIDGIEKLDRDVKNSIVEKSGDVVVATSVADLRDEKIRILCPLNIDGLCMLYENRLMICRLHGVPYFFEGPRGRVEGPGCYRFDSLSEGKRSVAVLDRTDIYRDLAMLEMDVRKAFGITSKFKKSIAEMIHETYAGGNEP